VIEVTIYGFVYIWFDRKRRMFYIGSHHGSKDDGYLGSSQRFLRAIKKRPKDFKRRIIEKILIDDSSITRRRETVWLQKIDSVCLGDRYYNLKRVAFGGNLYEGRTETQMKVTSDKLSASRLGEKHPRARAVVIDGVRYATKSEAKIVLGFDPTKRLESRRLAHRSFYYEDEGPVTIAEAKAHEQALKDRRYQHACYLGKLNSDRSDNWHRDRLAKAAKSHRGKKHKPMSIEGRARIAASHIGLKHSVVSIEKMRVARRAFWEKKRIA
jgi:hypothetical protein